MQWCGLKSHDPAPFSRVAPSPLMQWCGLKSPTAQLLAVVALVTTDAVVWIEIGGRGRDYSAGRRHH